MTAESTLPPEEMEGVPEGIRRRLHFQLEAAGIQSDFSTLVVQVSDLFKTIYKESVFSREDRDRALGWAREGRRLKERWDALEPPEAAAQLVREISDELGDLNRLFDRVAELRDGSRKELEDQVAALQADFNSQLALMNETEQELLGKEKEMKDAGHA